MRILILSFSLMLFMPCIAQQNKIIDDSATVEFSLTNFQYIPIKNAGLFLTFQHNNKTISVLTNNEGKATLRIPEGSSFKIRLEKGEEIYIYEDIFEIPDEEGAFLYNIDLKFEMRTFILDNVEFDFNKATLRPSSFEELNQVAEMMQQIDTVNIMISGHTDDVGSDEYNMNLSLNRAKSVRFYLIKKGIDSSRIKTEGFGESKPIDTNQTEVGRQRNRRIEVQILE